MSLELTNILYLLIIFQSWLFAGVLFGKTGHKRISNWLLGAFLFALGLQMLLYLIADLGFSGWHMSLVSFVFTYGPLMFLYTRSLIWQDFQLRQLDSLHFLPFIIFLSIGLMGYDLRVGFGWLLYISIGIYLWLAYRDINRYRRVLQQTRTSNSDIDLAWLKLTLGLFSLVLFADLFSYLIELWFSSSSLNYMIDYVVLALVVFFVNTMVYKGLKQPQIFGGISESEHDLVNNTTEKLSKVLLEKEHANTIQRLEKYMEEEQPFRNPQLSINELATQLNIPARRLSQIINQYYGQNFSDFINTHRIELAQQRLASPIDSKETILEILYDVGFNSKSSFNTIFKKKTGMTPSAYKEKVRRQHP